MVMVGETKGRVSAKSEAWEEWGSENGSSSARLNHSKSRVTAAGEAGLGREQFLKQLH